MPFPVSIDLTLDRADTPVLVRVSGRYTPGQRGGFYSTDPDEPGEAEITGVRLVETGAPLAGGLTADETELALEQLVEAGDEESSEPLEPYSDPWLSASEPGDS